MQSGALLLAKDFLDGSARIHARPSNTIDENSAYLVRPKLTRNIAVIFEDVREELAKVEEYGEGWDDKPVCQTIFP